MLVNQSLRCSTVPDLWKNALVFPHSEVKEYDDVRLISLLCFFAKVLSKITFSQLNHYFESNSLHVENICAKALSFGMKLNPKKSKRTIIGRPGVITKIDFSIINKIKVNNEEIQYSETVKYLGVIWDRSMSPKP